MQMQSVQLITRWKIRCNKMYSYYIIENAMLNTSILDMDVQWGLIE